MSQYFNADHHLGDSVFTQKHRTVHANKRKSYGESFLKNIKSRLDFI